MKVVDKVFGTHSERELKRIESLVQKIENLRDSMVALSDAELKEKTKEYKNRIEVEKHWILFYLKHMPQSGKQQEEFLIWNIIVCS